MVDWKGSEGISEASQGAYKRSKTAMMKRFSQLVNRNCTMLSCRYKLNDKTKDGWILLGNCDISLRSSS